MIILCDSPLAFYIFILTIKVSSLCAQHSHYENFSQISDLYHSWFYMYFANARLILNLRVYSEVRV